MKILNKGTILAFQRAFVSFHAQRRFKMDGPIVQTSNGLVQGAEGQTESGRNFYSFAGVPYAEPPVGKMRFREAVPAMNWSGIKDCRNEKPGFVQHSFFTHTIIGTEELFLTVYTPRLPSENKEPLPVLVHIHGGLFKSGVSCRPEANPDYLLDEGVVFVGIESRLGVFGYLCLDTPEVPGNVGLKDQVLALKWVQENVARFGGDPENVSLYGLSSGGALVDFHMLSPKSKGLFHKVIYNSGGCLPHWSTSYDPIGSAFRLGKTLGYTGSSKEGLVQFLEGIPAGELASEAHNAQVDEMRGGLYAPFAPVVEKEFDNVEPFLKANPLDLLKSGDFSIVPCLTGICEKEGLLLGTFRNKKLTQACQTKDLFSHLPYRIKKDQEGRIRDQIDAVYTSKLEIDINNNLPDAIMDFFGDIDQSGGIMVAAKLIAMQHPHVYLYCFTYDGNFNYAKKNLNLQYKGACHCDHEGYLFGNSFKTEKCEPDDLLVRDRMVRLWANFMKTGNPTPRLSPVIRVPWKPLDPKKMNYMEIGRDLKAKENLLGERRQLWEDIYLEARLHSVDRKEQEN